MPLLSDRLIRKEHLAETAGVPYGENGFDLWTGKAKTMTAAAGRKKTPNLIWMDMEEDT